MRCTLCSLTFVCLCSSRVFLSTALKAQVLKRNLFPLSCLSSCVSLGLHPCGSVGQKVKTRRGKRHLCSICWQWQRAVIVNGPFYVSFMPSRRASTKTKIVFRAARVALLSSKTYFKTIKPAISPCVCHL